MSFSWESLPLLSISWNFERGFVDSWCVFLENLFLCYLISWIFERGFIGSWCVFLQLGLLTFVKFDFVRRWKSPGSSNARWLMLPRVRLPAVSLGRWRRLSMSSRSDFRYRMHFFACSFDRLLCDFCFLVFWLLITRMRLFWCISNIFVARPMVYSLRVESFSTLCFVLQCMRAAVIGFRDVLE